MKRMTAALLGSIALFVSGAVFAASGGLQIQADDIGGVVRGPSGPEAGVWVIAETDELPTRLIKVVVTDDQGRYLLPDLPDATYSVWVRGYGLVDSDPANAEPGATLNLTQSKRRAKRKPRNIIQRTTGSLLSKSRTRASFQGPDQAAMESIRVSKHSRIGSVI